ncbi:MAG: hypothetical protein JNM93_05665 [Bacteriovoracaceae bacterium]|nr:hypothetical protein [Bacteriovoracaceae bacterium]
MNKITNLYALFFLVGCATASIEVAQQAESFNRVETHEVASGMPNFYLMDYKFTNQRAPASSESGRKFQEVSNKKIYFLTLYSQHLILKNYLNHKTETLNSCPQFHHELLINDDALKSVSEKSQTSVVNNSQYSSLSESQLAYFPELALTLANKNEVHQMMKGKASVEKLVNEALLVHYQKNLSELETLCEYGRSDNYYIFENTINYFETRPELLKTPVAIRAVLKIPVAANMLLIHSLMNTGISYTTQNDFVVFNSFESEALTRLQGKWLGHYITTLKSQRNVAMAKLQIAE